MRTSYRLTPNQPRATPGGVNGYEVEDDFTVFFIGSSPSDPAPIPFYAVNPHRMTRTIVDHFGKFIHELRTSTDAELHQKFLEFVQDFHEPHSMELPKPKFQTEIDTSLYIAAC